MISAIALFAASCSQIKIIRSEENNQTKIFTETCGM